MLKGTFPLHAMGFYSATVRFKGDQMRYLVDERNQKPVFIERGIHRNLVKPIGHSTIIPMAGNPMVYNLKVHPIGFDQLKTRSHSSFWKVFLKGGFH